MTVRVIKPGVKYAVCQHCNSELSYNPSDVQTVIHYDYQNIGALIRFIVCAECTKHVKLRLFDF